MEKSRALSLKQKSCLWNREKLKKKKKKFEILWVISLSFLFLAVLFSPKTLLEKKKNQTTIQTNQTSNWLEISSES